jgi:putative salt-induced outer membrane protein YdiY
MRRWLWFFVAFSICLACRTPASAGDKTDKVGLRNGDKLTCEVKKLESGLLEVSTDDMGTISIEWDKVASLESSGQYEVELSDGVVHFGSLGNSSMPAMMSVTSDTLAILISRSDVVNLIPIKAGFWERLDGSVSLGFSYTKANTLLQLNSSANVVYRARNKQSEVNMNSVITAQEGQDQTQRFDFTFDQTFLFKGRWYGTGGVGVQRNTALGLDLRLLAQGVGGNQIVQTNSNALSVGAGLSANREWLIDQDSYNLEALATISHSKFRYDKPHVNLVSKLTTYFNLTHAGRFRLEFNTNLSWEIFTDFYVRFSLYDSYNNSPPPGSPLNDWNTSFSLAYSF